MYHTYTSMQRINALFAKSGFSWVTGSMRTYPTDAVRTFSLCQSTLGVQSKGDRLGDYLFPPRPPSGGTRLINRRKHLIVKEKLR